MNRIVAGTHFPGSRVAACLFLAFCLFLGEAKGQDPDADSLFAPLVKLKPDTARFRACYALCIRFMFDWRGKQTAARARSYAEKMLQAAQSGKDPVWVPRLELSVAALYFLEAQDKAAFVLVEKAEPSLRKQGDFQALSELHYLKGHLYRDIERYDRMEEEWKKGLDLARKYRLFYQQQSILGTMANDYLGEKEFAKAEPLYLEALRVPQAPRDLARSYSDVSIFYARSKQLPKARVYADSALQLALRYEFRDLYSIFYFNQACMAMDEGNLEEAERIGLTALRHAGGERRLDHQVSTYRFLRDVALRKQDYRKVYEYGERFHFLEDSLQKSRTQMELRELDTKYQTAVKENTIRTQKQELERKENQRRLLQAGIGVLLLVSVLSGLVFYLVRKRRESQLLQARADSEMKALRAQMNPHFMFNALNAIQQLVLNQETDQAFRYLGTYGKLTRQILENSEKTAITVSEEVKFLDLYLKMESLRFDHNFSFELVVGEEILPHSDKLPAMVVQPLVENAIKHGLLPRKSGQRHLLVSFQKAEESGPLEVWVEDNGVGRSAPSSPQDEHRSMSLDITRHRLQLWDKSGRSRLVFEDLKHPDGSPAGTRAKLIVSSPS